MKLTIGVFVLVYMVALFSYFFSETSGNLKRRAINKIFLSTMFLLLGMVSYALNYSFFSYKLFCLIAIFFAFLGDVFLLYSFTKGGILFIISNIFFFVYEWIFITYSDISFVDIGWFILLFISLFGTFFILTIKKVLNFKTKNIQILTYVFCVTLCGSLGITMALRFMNTEMVLFGIGMGLFMISDYFLMVYKFKKHKNWILRANSACYFIGLLMVAFCFIF